MNAALRRVWQGLSGRERVGVGLALVLLVLAAAWWGALRPALRTVASAPAQLARLDAQLMTMRTQAQEAARLRQQVVPSRAQVLAAVDASVRQQLGPGASFQAQEDRVSLTLRGVPPAGLGVWLGQVRSASGAAVEQIDLRRGPEGWDGSIVLLLPGAP